MGTGTALKKINAEAKRLRKKHPNAKYSTLQKQAGKAYKAGRLKKVGGVKKRKAVKKTVKRKERAVKRAVRKAVARVRVVRVMVPAKRRRARRAVKAVRRSARRRVSGIGSVVSGVKSLMMPALLIGGAFVLYELLKPKTAAVLVQRTNPTAAAAQTSLVQYATAAGLGIDAISKLIAALNASSDSDVINGSSNPASTVQALTGPTSTVVAPTGGGSLSIPDQIFGGW